MNYTDDTIESIEIDNGIYALIYPDRVAFISDIEKNDICGVIDQESKIMQSEPKRERAPDKNYAIVFIPTLDCNLRCGYCYARGGEDKVYLTPQAAVMAVDNLAENIRDCRDKTLLLHFVGGGEPFLNFPCIEKVTAYGKEKFGGVRITIVTNGTFGKKELDWIIENKAGMRISYDGVFNDMQRPYASGQKSSNIVEKNIRTIVREDPAMVVKMTVTDDSLSVLMDSVRKIASLGVKRIHIKPVHHSLTSRDNGGIIKDTELYVKTVLDVIETISREKLGIKLVNTFDIQPNTGLFCRSCTGEVPVITPDGSISACVEVARKRDPFADILIYGNSLSSGGYTIDTEKLSFLQKFHYSNYSTCVSCELRKLCLGGCPLEAAAEHNDFFTPGNFRCAVKRALLPRLLRMIYFDNNILEIVSDL